MRPQWCYRLNGFLLGGLVADWNTEKCRKLEKLLAKFVIMLLCIELCRLLWETCCGFLLCFVTFLDHFYGLMISGWLLYLLVTWPWFGQVYISYVISSILQ